MKELMKRFGILITIFAALILSACGGETSLPVATGKANIRAINGVKTAPDVGFLIEERTLGAVGYRQITSSNRSDDLTYNFNFDVLYAGEPELVRIASILIDIVKDLDYVLVLTGTLADPSILVWETTDREFTGTETIFEARFAHTAASLGNVDYYFAALGVDPLVGEEAGTLSFGDVLPSIDYEAGEYVLTITAEGMPGQVLYESAPTNFNAASQLIISSFDGDANTFAPVVTRAFASSFDLVGGSIVMPDTHYPPTAEFVNGSLAIGTVDIYEDALLSSQIVAGHAYKDVSDELEVSPEAYPVLYTPTTLLSPVLIDDEITFFGGIRGRVVAYGESDDLQIRSYAPDRQSTESKAKLQIFNSATNFDFVSVFVEDADTPIEDILILLPRSVIPSGSADAAIGLAAGSFDIYLTNVARDIVLAGPIRIDVEYGDVLGGMIFETIDPDVLELDFLPNNP
jgi:hypothetical protein